MTEDEDYDALSQKQLASIKRDMRISLEDAAVRATHKVMAEFEVLTRPEQQAEPVCPNCKAAVLYECVACSSNNYPPKRPWVGLTEFQFAEIYNKWNDTNGSTPWGLNQALEARLKEKNT